MTKKVKFKKRYVLGTGYPYIYGPEINHGTKLSLSLESIGLDLVALEWPEELWDKELPQYRLVLERVEKDTKK